MRTITISLILIVSCILCAGIAGAYETPESIVAAGKVSVSDVTYDPQSFFTGDTGTVAIEVTNGATDQGILISHASFSDPQNAIRLTGGEYTNTANIGPGKTQTFTFSVIADAKDGTYYPQFSVDFRDADSMYERTVVKIDNTPLVLSLIDKPDTFAQDRKKSVTVQVSNPRDSSVKNVILDVSGTGATVTPAKIFLGELQAGANKTAAFAITPSQPTTLTVTAHYDNGDNTHVESIDLPIVFGVDKKQANPVVSNVVAKSETGTFHITGDVTNAGLETANAVTITSSAPAVPQDPYRSYIVGALKPDDFGSFELTFTATGVTTVPLQLTFKDSDGNVISSQYTVQLPALTATQEKSGLPVIPIAVVVIAVAVFAGGWFLYLKRNKQ